jgi:hypothetical protein
MEMTPEGKVKRDFRKWVEAQSAIDVWGFWPVKRVEGQNGIPDWVGIVGGKPVGIEMKATDGKVKGIQKSVHRKMILAGWEILIMDPANFDEVIDELESWI